MLTWRTERQATTLAIIVFVVLAVIAFFAYKVYPAPTCFDTRKNQNETGIDCGGSCIPCELKNPKQVDLVWARIIPVRADSFDVAAEIRNPNEVLGVRMLEYEFTLFDGLGVIARKTGTTFLFPQERMHVIETDLRTSRRPDRVEFRVMSVDWKLARGEEVPNIVVERRDYRLKEEGGRKKSIVEASIFNKMPFGYKTVEVNFIVRDFQENALGVSRVRVENIGANSRKTLIAIWPEELRGDIAKIDVEPRVNIFDANIIRPTD